MGLATYGADEGSLDCEGFNLRKVLPNFDFGNL